MNSYAQKLKRYQPVNVPEGGQPRYTEAWALVEAARRMAVSIGSGEPDSREQRQGMKSAIRLNWRLWTIFQAELTSAESDAPLELRQNMLSLCQFVDRHTVGCLAEPTPDKLRHLIDLNRNIAAGLMGSTSDDPDEDRRNKEAAGIPIEEPVAAAPQPTMARQPEGPPADGTQKLELDV